MPAMNETIPCPTCGEQLAVPAELLEGKIRCPACGRTIVVSTNRTPISEPIHPPNDVSPIGAPAAGAHDPFDFDANPDVPLLEPEPEPDEEPADRRAWRRVRGGVSWVIAGVVVAVATFAMTVSGAYCIGVLFSNPGARGLWAVACMLFLGLLASKTASIVGQVWCCSVPTGHGSRVLARATLALTGCSLLVDFGTAGWALLEESGDPLALIGQGDQGGTARLLRDVSNVLALGGLLVFLFFLRAVAAATRDRYAARSLFYLIALGITCLVVTVAAAGCSHLLATESAACLGGAARDGRELVAALLGGFVCLDFILVLTFLIAYPLSLFQVRDCITNQIRRGLL